MKSIPLVWAQGVAEKKISDWDFFFGVKVV